MQHDDISWHLGNCIGTDPEVWFQGDSHNKYEIQNRICSNCEIKEQCLEWALENQEEGFWGGQYFTSRGDWEQDVDTGQVHIADNGDSMSEVWRDAA